MICLFSKKVSKAEMSGFELKLKEENENIKGLFNSDRDEIKEIFPIFIRNSKNDSKYFINLMQQFSTCRPHKHHVSRELIECVYSCFPEQINEIQNEIKEENILKYIIFPEEFPIDESKE